MRNFAFGLGLLSTAAAVGAAAALTGCLADPGVYAGPDAGGVIPGDPDAAPPANTSDVSGDITQDATWTDGIHLTAAATIKAGVTITVAAGAQITAATDATLTVEGTLSIEGTDAAGVILKADTGVADWGGVNVASGGSATLRFVDASGAAELFYCGAGASLCAIEDSHFHGAQIAATFLATGSIARSNMEANGVVHVQAGSDVTMTDSVFTGTSGDLIIGNGGSMTVEYCQVATDATGEHCGFHINSAATVNINHNIFVGNAYAFMLGGTSNALINHNNFINSASMDVENLGTTTNIDLTGNYWDNGPVVGTPVPASFDVSGAVMTPFTDVGPRP